MPAAATKGSAPPATGANTGGRMPARGTIDMSKQVKAIRGRIGAKALKRAPMLFNASHVFPELFQNSRRAGATRIDVTAVPSGEGGFVTVTDDGHGVDDLQSLATFGESDWQSESMDAIECAAGMGSFSLATRGMSVRSNGYQADITPAVFVGEAEALATPCDFPRGTSITFRLTAEEWGGSSRSKVENHYEADIARSAFHLPVPVTLNGKPLPRRDFLAHATKVVRAEGVRIGIYDAKAAAARDRDFHDALAGSASPWERHAFRVEETKRRLNFHGHQARCPSPGRLLEPGTGNWHALYDVENAPGISLVLPTRDEAIENEALSRLTATARKAMLEAVSELDSHRLAMATVVEARSLGIAMRDPELLLRRWSGASPDMAPASHRPEAMTEDALSRAVLACGASGSNAADLLLQLYSKESDAGSGHVIYEADANYEGLPAYDAIGRIGSFRIEAEGTDGTKATWHAALGDEPDRALVAAALGLDADEGISSLALRITVTPIEERIGGVKTAMAPADVPFLLLSEGHERPDDHYGFEFMATKAAVEEDQWALAWSISTVLFRYATFNEREVEYDREDYAADLRERLFKLAVPGDEFMLAGACEKAMEMAWRLGIGEDGIVEVVIKALPRPEGWEGGNPPVSVTARHATGKTKGQASDGGFRASAQ